ncbi:unnamed protein product [Candidula unifasciata]|uniref:Deoxynucleoside kinase domain-containing protein n=1 Tax=Candidula unifasciata TaxID=100452 RepID=A0A8S3Z3U7_9EUPU|nr:unnamed protein product [Candidula unifasciata]
MKSHLNIPDTCNPFTVCWPTMPLNSKTLALARKLSQHFPKFLVCQQNCHFDSRSVSSLSSRIRKRIKSNEQSDHSSEMEAATRTPRFVVSIEGNIGSGKTEMLNYYQKTQNCEIVPEPVEKWRNIQGYNALELMYENPERWGMALQTYIQLTMLQLHKLPQEKPVRLIERSIFSAKYCFVENLFRSGKMPEIEYLILTEWFEWIIKTQNIQLDLIVYLRTDPELLHERIMRRCRPEEKCIPLDYLKTLHQLHEDWLLHKKFPCPAEVLVIDGNSALEKMPESYEQHRNKIVNPLTY